MRQFLVGTALLVSALLVTFATASILQNLAETKRTIVAEPSLERGKPSSTATRGPRAEPGGRSVIISARHVEL